MKAKTLLHKVCDHVISNPIGSYFDDVSNYYRLGDGVSSSISDPLRWSRNLSLAISVCDGYVISVSL